MLSRLGTALVVLGLAAIAYGVLWQLGLAPGSRVTLPQPVALERAAPGTREVSATLAPTALPATAFPTPRAVAATPTPLPVAVAGAPMAAARARSDWCQGRRAQRRG